MAQERDVQRGSAEGQTLDAEVVETGVAERARFAAGETPAVAGSAPAASPTASELAYGPGVSALDALLAGTPAPKQIVELIDAHRAESAAMLALVEVRRGAAFAGEVREAMGLRASIRRRELVYGDPTAEAGGYFLGSSEGARWRTAGGDFTGTAGRGGLDSTYRLDADDALRARVDRSGTGTLGWDHGGERIGELYGGRTRPRDSELGGKGWELGARRAWELEGGGQLTTGLRHRVRDGTATDGAFVGHVTDSGRTASELALGVSGGQPAGSLSVSHRASERDSFGGELLHDARGTRLVGVGTHGLDGGASVAGRAELAHGDAGTTGSLAARYADPRRVIDARIAREADHSAFHLGGTERLSPELALSGSLDHVSRHGGADQTTLRLGQAYRSEGLVHRLDMEAGRGERDYVGTRGSVDARLAPDLYAGAFGSYQREHGQRPQAQVGASLTFTPHERAALTLAGVLDQSGALETRLQLDLFKSRLRDVRDIADHKKDALVSLFLSYTQRGTPGMLDDRYGKPQVGGGDSTVRAGIRIRF